MRFVFGLIGSVCGAVAGLGGLLLVRGIQTNYGDKISALELSATLSICAMLGIVMSETTAWNTIRSDGNTKIRTVMRAAIWVTVPITVGFGMGLLGDFVQTPPSDDALLVNFKENRKSLEQIVALDNGKYGRVDQYSVDGNIDSNAAAIRELMRKSNVKGWLRAFDVNRMQFACWSGEGMLLPFRSHKGYVYCDYAPNGDFKTSLDGLDLRSGQRIECFKHITGNWYLYANDNSEDALGV